jgi:HSP20 family molecular chaperone IbpA
MTDTNREMTKKEANVPEGVERTKPRRVFKPDVDITEQKDDTVLTADLPGVDDKSLDITLEKNVITIRGKVEPEIPAGYRLAYGEYEVGDYERAFTLSDEVDKDRIQATIKNGVLRLVLPKAAAAKARKIAISAA